MDRNQNSQEIRQTLCDVLDISENDSLLHENMDDNNLNLEFGFNGEQFSDIDGDDFDENYSSNGGDYGSDARVDEMDEELIEAGAITGMRFTSINSLFKFYQEHARRKGFCVRKRSSKRFGGIRKYITLTCDKSSRAYCKKFSKRTNCPAKLNAKLESDGMWHVTKVINIHSHELDPSMSRLMAGHRVVGNSLKRNLEANDRAGLRICKSIRLMEVQCGGPENMGCTPKDCRNFINSNRRLKLEEGDAESIRKFFCDMQRNDRDFFHSMDIDNVGRLRNMLWIHPQAKIAYEEFHDVISFDTTYLVNKYRMPFASFVGVNHHCQSILLGCALLSHEDINTFKWLFSTWISAMRDIYPNAIMTDQCESIKAAINEVMPNTIHRLCIWHIFTKLPLKLRGVRNYASAKQEFKALVLDSITIEEFERRWNNFVESYHLERNEWLIKLYVERQSWVPVFLNHFFWAGMLSTQRSEGMHAYFDGFVNSQSTLKQFVEQYELALRYKYEKELSAEFKSKYIECKCETGFLWEEQLQKAYTRTIFNLFQDQIRKLYHCDLSYPQNDQENGVDMMIGVEKFLITDGSIKNDFYGNQFVYTVEYRLNGQYFNCNCKFFESRGIICCHILKLMSHKKIHELNERYVLRRWRRDVFRPHLKKFFYGGYPTMSAEYKRYRELLKYFEHVTDIGMDNDMKMRYVKVKMLELKNDLLNWDESMVVPDDTFQSQEGERSGQAILDPLVTRSRGRPRTNRYKSRVERHTRSRGGRSIRGSGAA